MEGPLLSTAGYHPADPAHGCYSSLLASSLEPGSRPKETVTLVVALRFGHSLLGAGALPGATRSLVDREEAHNWRDWRTPFPCWGLQALLSETVRATGNKWPRPRKHGLSGALNITSRLPEKLGMQRDHFSPASWALMAFSVILTDWRQGSRELWIHSWCCCGCCG